MRNRKKRIVQPQLVEAVARLLAPGGQVFLQSDVQEVSTHLVHDTHQVDASCTIMYYDTHQGVCKSQPQEQVLCD